MSDKIIVRPWQETDVPDITRIYAHHVLHGTASWELTPPDEAEMRRRAESVRAGAYPYIVAEIDGRVVGYAYANSYRPRPAYRFTVEHSIYIDNDVRRTGIGGVLMEALVDICTESGFRQMIAVIGDSENRQSICFHEKNGFAHAGKIDNIGFKFGRWLDQILMQRTLGEGAQTLPTDRD